MFIPFICGYNKASLIFRVFSNTVAASADLIFSFFDSHGHNQQSPVDSFLSK